MKPTEPIDLRLSLKGLTLAPSQRLGALRIVPLTREAPVPDLLLDAVAPLRPPPEEDARKPVFWLPHGVVSRWEPEGPFAAFGTQISPERHVQHHAWLDLGWSQREDGATVRWAPLPVFQEGLLLSVLGANEGHWARFTAGLPQGIRRGLRFTPNAHEALSTFEPEDGQCGALVYAGDTLLMALVLPSAETWAFLHRALMTDLLGEYVRAYGQAENPFRAELNGAAVRSLDDLRLAVAQTRARWASPEVISDGRLLRHDALARSITPRGGFTIVRMTTPQQGRTGNFVGEAVFGRDHQLAALVLSSMSWAQSRRAYLMQMVLAAKGRSGQLARALGAPLSEVDKRLANNGLRYLIEGK